MSLGASYQGYLLYVHVQFLQLADSLTAAALIRDAGLSWMSSRQAELGSRPDSDVAPCGENGGTRDKKRETREPHAGPQAVGWGARAQAIEAHRGTRPLVAPSAPEGLESR